MTTQSEAQLEANLIAQLQEQGYARAHIPDEKALLANLKLQLEAHNNTRFSESEFARILNHLNQGNVFDCAKTLREQFNLCRDDGSEEHIRFLNTHEWCQNRFQVANQITQRGNRENRYDVTILINGLPLVQIELKRRGLEINEAFHQINRYHRESFGAGSGLFQFVQIFVISNGVNTKYYANNRKQSVEQTFTWSDEHNRRISNLSDFAALFLAKCHIAKMICRHTVLHETNKILMVLRPYQVFAVEAIVERVMNTRLGGYIWHTTGSGKTLTSFKAAQLITKIPEIEKVVFVVDRVDLDYQTMREFNAYKRESVDGSSNTSELVRHFGDANSKLVVTTIQKLNRAINYAHHDAVMKDFHDKRVVLIFDECHRSQFGKTHQRIIKHFEQAQLFGFTGTPIFAANAVTGVIDAKDGVQIKRTTKDLFGKCLHKYLITDAIADRNVLPFSLEYWGRLRARDGSLIDDEMVAGINRKEWFEGEDRIEHICNWILANHNRKTHDRNFTAILAVGSIAAACKYYDRLKELRELGKHDLHVATIFSAPANEDDPDADGHLPADDQDDIEAAAEGTIARQKLDQYIADYNEAFNTGFNTRDRGGFYKYYRDISKRIKAHDREDYNTDDRIDVLLVVNMFLTGFDAMKLNTLYVDKNLRQQGLIQAYSRTNRIFNKQKSHGNIICFRNLIKSTDEALELFADSGAETQVFLDDYEVYVTQFNEKVIDLLKIVASPSGVDRLADEEAKGAFIKAFRSLIRVMNTLKGFALFKWSDVSMTEQTFADFRSKYLDLHDEIQLAKEINAPASILQDIDFELALIRRDEINVNFILKLLASAPATDNQEDQAERSRIRNRVMTLLDGEVQLRSKRDLIKQFIEEYWDGMEPSGDIFFNFNKFWAEKRQAHLEDICAEEELDFNGVEALIGQYSFTSRPPLGKDIIKLMKARPNILNRRDRIHASSKKIMKAIEIFETM